ncbi:MAG: hypothetical protein OEQ39_14285 [Gammaproteobacteria bacterium]|nr:hypothetical protein [Gammaproteobacteria bacterium]MDH3466080.1 hypothetical protein [Gammaproteobacteria bacterium]
MCKCFNKQQLGLLVLGSLMCGQTAIAGNDWRWGVTPYLWGSDIDYDAQVNDGRVGGSVAFSDLVDQLEGALQVHVEGHSPGPWGVFGDLTYIALSDTITTGVGARVDTDTDVTLVELGGVYTASEGVDILFGVRSLGLDMEIAVTPPGAVISADPSLVDALLGVRFSGDLSDRWGYLVRADVSGGDSEGTWNVLAGASLNFGAKGNKRALFGYRHMEIETEREGASNLAVELTMSGPIAGVEFAF